MALPQERWAQCAAFFTKGKGLAINFNGQPDQLRTRIRNAILAAGIENESIDTVITVGGQPYGIRSTYTVRGTYERMFGFDLVTDLPNGL